MMDAVDRKYHGILSQLRHSDQLRSLKAIDTRKDKFIRYQGRDCLNLTSNDYLGLATDQRLCEAFYDGMDKKDLINAYGLGASSSRLLTGNSSLYEALEKALCQWYDSTGESCRQALVFNSGYHANAGVIPALAGKNDLIVSDSLNHASIIDGIRLSRAECRIFPHNDIACLETILAMERERYETVLIITESIFSMDGDRADLQALVAVKNRYDALLYIDEAHSAGLFGSDGQGLCFAEGVADQVDILLGTMGKALASHGAYIITRPVIKDYLINCSRSLIYTTALPPVAVSWSLFVLRQMPFLAGRRKHLETLSAWFRQALEKEGLSLAGDSHIIPVMVGSNGKTVAISEQLFEQGILAFAIRPPSVPVNQARIRFSMTADIVSDDISAIPALIKELI